ncbi:MAG: type III-B CRISPR module RAMP protein Cmr1 [Chloroflexia bacterium]|nr:type III-B CRISPR module RAMP protein Cmr1 [Chloroflexia bacterium]
METITFSLETLTPLWTGGVERGCDRLHETGLIGSLRWWYEAILRGMGEQACDPTARAGARCQDQHHCPACDLFGCTGWARRFRLQCDDGEPAFTPLDESLSFKPPPRTNGWHLGPGRVASGGSGIHGRLITLRETTGGVANLALVALQLASLWGGLGARTQHGYGVLRYQAQRRGQAIQADPTRFLALHPAGPAAPPYGGPHPALTDMFFARFRFAASERSKWWDRRAPNNEPLLGAYPPTIEKWGGASKAVPVAPAVKNQLRYEHPPFATAWGPKREIFGHLAQRRKARIQVSAAYREAYREEEERWTLRLWGWMPRTQSWRSSFLDDLYQVLHQPTFWEGAFGRPLLVDLGAVTWREFDSRRDTVRRITDRGDYMTSLLAGEGL